MVLSCAIIKHTNDVSFSWNGAFYAKFQETLADCQ